MTMPGGYGRYKDDPSHVGCPRARSDMTPCVARDGHIALEIYGRCVGCDQKPHGRYGLLQQLRHEITGKSPAAVTIAEHAADKLRDLVRRVTDPETAMSCTGSVPADHDEGISRRSEG